MAQTINSNKAAKTAVFVNIIHKYHKRWKDEIKIYSAAHWHL